MTRIGSGKRGGNLRWDSREQRFASKLPRQNLRAAGTTVVKPSKARSAGKGRVRAIPSSEPTARDEGPRLIPLHSEEAEVPMSHYLQLADTALGTTTVKKKREQPGEEEAPE